MKKNIKRTAPAQYSLNADGAFVISNYNQARPFSNFFPGIAGLWGIPMWVFYVNRGQCIASFGIESKDKSILEFQPANKAYRLTASQGFRTFIRLKSKNKTFFYEPFVTDTAGAFTVTQKMSISSHDLTIEETNETLGLKVAVNYFTLPEEPYSALIRRVTISNISRKPQQIELIDGLSVINPYGTTDWLLKNMTRTVEAWVNVNNLKKRAPFYHLKVVVNDKPAVEHIHEGNFYFAFTPDEKGGQLLDPIVETACVFGAANDFKSPEAFLKQKNFKVPAKQQTANRMPCAMSFAKFRLLPKGEKQVISLAGYAHEEETLNRMVTKVLTRGFIDKKAQRNKEMIEEVKNFALTNSASSSFNQYSGQTFLDNVLRGGLPVSLKTGDGTIAFNVFSRKHGDPERDYNHFVLAPTYFSQGNGNYRDVNQNRRHDAWFNPHVRDNGVMNFLNLIQADGYNPLVVKGMSFYADPDAPLDNILKDSLRGEEGIAKLKAIIIGGFQPGELLRAVNVGGFHLKGSPQEFLTRILGFCHKSELADHGEGFWTDHWTYNLDLLESYLSLYPEELENLLLKKKSFSFYHNSHYVLPRDSRYVLTSRGVRQYHSIADGAKEFKISPPNSKLVTKNGEGPVYFTNLIVKLLCLVANKTASFDPSGIGIEMEAEKPNWYDALNGLPGLLGSSTSEMLELKRLCLFLSTSFAQLSLSDSLKISVFEELASFATCLNYELSLESDPLACWMKANDLKEQYRQRIRKGISGAESEMSIGEIKEFLALVIAKTDRAAGLAKKSDGVLATYFTHEVTQHKVLDKKDANGLSHVRPLNFKLGVLPLFLEGFVHALRVERNKEDARKLYQQVRKSPLFDEGTKMYKVNADLSGESEEIGRTRIFPAGWLENGSIWLHMEYKFLLEVLRAGLYDEFFNDFKSVLIPFLNPERYGRSILENSSFIVSSAHEDRALHGQGFVARLSGSTAEFLHMWLMMNAGQKPFGLDGEGNLQLTLKPVLPEWLFTKKETTVNYFGKDGQWQKIKLPANTYTFHFMGALVVYHNPRRKDTFGPQECEIRRVLLTYPRQQPVSIPSAMVPSPYAGDIREHKVDRIDVFFS